MNSLNIATTGIITVFIALVLIALAITLFSRIIQVRKKKVVHTPAKPAESSVKTLSSTESKDDMVSTANDIPDQEIAAVIAAALQAALSGREVKTRISVRSFKRISGETPIWKSASWHEQIRNIQPGQR